MYYVANVDWVSQYTDIRFHSVTAEGISIKFGKHEGYGLLFIRVSRKCRRGQKLVRNKYLAFLFSKHCSYIEPNSCNLPETNKSKYLMCT